MDRKQTLLVLIGALALGFVGGIASRYLMEERDQDEIVLDIAEIRHELKTLKDNLEHTLQETTLSIASLTSTLKNTVEKVKFLEEEIAGLQRDIQPKGQLEQTAEENELKPPSFEIRDFTIKNANGYVEIVVVIQNTSNMVATFTPFVRCNQGIKYLWSLSIGSVYLAPGEQDQISFKPYRSFGPGSYTFTLTHIWIEAISKEGKRLGSWEVPVEGYVETLVIE